MGFVMCGCVYVWGLCLWMCVCVGFVLCGCVYVWVSYFVGVRKSWFYNVWVCVCVCVCVGFVTCGSVYVWVCNGWVFV